MRQRFSKGPLGIFLAFLLPASQFQASEAVAPVGSCISSPEDSCTSLMAICIGKVLGGQVASNQLWSSPECFSAAICTGIGSLLDALCCAGTCKQPLDIQSLDYNLLRLPAQWLSYDLDPFVNWYYSTIQATGTNSWPQDGDQVLEWWRQLATWTAFCVGDRCVNGAIPKPPSNDPADIFGDIESDIWQVTASGPCASDDITDCWYDYGPPSKLLNGQIIPNGPTSLTSRDAKPKQAPIAPHIGVFGVPSEGLRQFGNVNDPSILPFVGPNGPRNCPPPIFIQDGTVSVPLNISGCPDVAKTQKPRRRTPEPEFTYSSNLTFNPRTASLNPSACEGSTDTPVPLPVLTYYCDRLPEICASIRSTNLLANDQIILTYDPFNDKTRRGQVCPDSVVAAMKLAGKCDKRRHDPANWQISCDEFPFNSALEGGAGNAIVMASQPASNNIKDPFRLGFQNCCVSKETERVPATAPLKAVGELARGAAFFAKKTDTAPSVFITDSRASAAPVPYPADVAYPSSATALKVPNGSTYNCAPQCNNNQVPRAIEDPAVAPTRTSPPLDIRAAAASPSCTRTQTKPTTTPEATAAAQADLSSAAAHAAAAAAALAAAVGLSPNVAAAAAAAVAAANSLAQSAAALTTAASSPAMAAAVSAANAAIFQAQSIADIFRSFGPNLPTSVTTIISEVLAATSDVAAAVEDISGVVPPRSP
ncbi:hypothetical protein BD779DRAFT_1671902 [Infundibulicybe gibba]|nr:hypothetical protein BD779DRAFT_1671902 [Infundibulicybe gibba]